ncbi:MAG: hypothetical protein KKD35_08295 [Elusimicrobia bacterium]|nr:hypothetical protein [Elusimicrobiota bacterium]
MKDFQLLFSENLFFIGAFWLILISGFIILKKSRIPYVLKIIRFSVIFLFSLFILNLSVIKSKKIIKKPSLSILIDSRYSMHGPEKNGSPQTKFEVAKKWLDKNIKEIKKHARPTVYIFAEEDYAFDLSVSSYTIINASNLSETFQKVIIDNPEMPDKFLVFTDGNWANDIEKENILRISSKIDFVGMGDYPEKKLARIEKINPPPFVFMHMPFEILWSIETKGYENKKLFLDLMDEKKSIIASEEIVSGTHNSVFTSSFTLRPDSIGIKKYFFTLRNETSSGVVLDKKEISIQVIREKTRIMYLCGKPSFEYARLREYLKKKENIELVSFIILRNAEDIINAPENDLSLIPFPIDEIFLKDTSLFDIFIIQNFDFNRFLINKKYLISLDNFVKQGGSILFLGGDNAFSSAGYDNLPILKNMLPVELSGSYDFLDTEFKIKPSAHPIIKALEVARYDTDFLNNLPELKGFNKFKKIRKDSRSVLNYTLEDGSEGVLFAEKNYGKGRTAVFASPSSWLWKLSEGRSWKLTGFYDAFWTSVLNYLNGSIDMGKVRLSVETDKVLSPCARLRILDDAYNRVADNKDVEINAFLEFKATSTPLNFRFNDLGIFEASIDQLNYGRQKIKVNVKVKNKFLGSDEISFEFKNPKNKFIPAHSAFLKDLASLSGGKYYSFKDIESDALVFDAKKTPEIKMIGEYNISNSMWFFGIFCILIFVEWILRRLSGYF